MGTGSAGAESRQALSGASLEEGRSPACETAKSLQHVQHTAVALAVAGRQLSWQQADSPLPWEAGLRYSLSSLAPLVWYLHQCH